jgi:uncharacterized damage-inducible protein DinB
VERRAFVELLHGRGAHALVLPSVQGIPFELAIAKVDGIRHSIWDLLWHVNYWMDYEVRRIAGEAPPYPAHASESWPASPPRDAREWEGEVGRFRNLLEKLEALGSSPDEALARKVESLVESHERIASSLGAVLWQTAVHNSYHLGQIVLLRERLSIWPPETGSDTW